MTKTNILDNIERIGKIDKSNMLSFCVNASKHYEEAAKIARKFSISYPKPQKIIVAGMGGSAIGGELLKDWARDKALVPIEVERDYSLPAYADKNTLVFVVSYSGETEETLSVFVEAIKKECMIVCVSSGGKLYGYAEKFGLPFIRVHSGIPPRAALPYLFTPLLIVLEKFGLVSNVEIEISEAINTLKRVGSENSPEKPSRINFSKTLALNVNGTVPIVYGFGFYRAVAQRFKQQFNENSKIPSKWEFLPELNHNEIVGWEKAGKMAKNFSAIFLRDEEEPKEIRERIEATKELMRKEKLKVFEVWSVGKSKLAKMLSTICIGDFTSVYLALLRGIDPTPVKTIALLKEKMKQSGVKEKILRELEKLMEK
ncbi:MAG: bifunctional phosphoglucose/phosphomannose isomerase [Candidatus Bathyarchaeota archaeon]|nr:bifunctional phosphoglucose/phosphomannose isomerase [Candidatus Bathyarchaeota archaeon]